MIICDADLEYSPEEIPSLLEPVLDAKAEVVYGTRTFGSHTAYSFWYVMGNKAVTMWANVLYNAWISDLETCFKLMPLALYRSLDVKSAGFGMEAEVTAKLLRSGHRPYEVPISYSARSREAGKKLTWRDGVEALWILARLRARRSGPIRAMNVGHFRGSGHHLVPAGHCAGVTTEGVDLDRLGLRHRPAGSGFVRARTFTWSPHADARRRAVPGAGGLTLRAAD